MKRTPMKYVVFGKDRISDILGMHLPLSTIDKIKFAIMSELLYEGCTMSDVMLVFKIHAIDYRVKRAMIDIKLHVAGAHELPDEISFVTCRAGEWSRHWDWYGRD